MRSGVTAYILLWLPGSCSSAAQRSCHLRSNTAFRPRHGSITLSARALNKLRPAGGTAATSLQIFYDLNDMDSRSSNKIKGSLHEAKGKNKQDTGKVTGNRDLEERGAAEKTGGKVEKKVGD